MSLPAWGSVCAFICLPLLPFPGLGAAPCKDVRMEQSQHHAKRLLPLSPPLGRRRVHPHSEGAPKVGDIVEAARKGDLPSPIIDCAGRGEEPSSAANPLVETGKASLSPPVGEDAGQGAGRHAHPRGDPVPGISAGSPKLERVTAARRAQARHP